MKNLIIAIAAFMMVSTAAATEVAKEFSDKSNDWKTKPVVCNKSHKIIELMKNYGEYPMVWMSGKVQLPNVGGLESQFVISVNTETFSWTLIEFMNKHHTGAWLDACILGSGVGLIEMNLIKKPGIAL